MSNSEGGRLPLSLSVSPIIAFFPSRTVGKTGGNSETQDGGGGGAHVIHPAPARGNGTYGQPGVHIVRSGSKIIFFIIVIAKKKRLGMSISVEGSIMSFSPFPFSAAA